MALHPKQDVLAPCGCCTYFFLAAGFLAAVFLAAGFLAALEMTFFGVVAFLAAGFLAAGLGAMVARRGCEGSP